MRVYQIQQVFYKVPRTIFAVHNVRIYIEIMAGLHRVVSQDGLPGNLTPKASQNG